VGVSNDHADDRLTVIDRYLRRVRYDQDQLIQTLHVAQEVYGYLPLPVLDHIARALRLPPSTVYGVATFYHLFTFDPPGEHSCTVCTGTACFVKGADDIVAAIGADTGLEPGSTDAEGRFTLRTTRCLGSCGLAPVLVLDGEVLSHQTPHSAVAAVRRSLAALEDV
jgi:bidirectional [NiFe] hydrogenase diaphorase subunit